MRESNEIEMRREIEWNTISKSIVFLRFMNAYARRIDMSCLAVYLLSKSIDVQVKGDKHVEIPSDVKDESINLNIHIILAPKGTATKDGLIPNYQCKR
jgi:hypothetical protein